VFLAPDPRAPMYGWKALTDEDYEALKHSKAVKTFRENRLATLAQPVLQQSPEETGLALIRQSDCVACHKEKVKLVGPAYADIAKKYGEKDVPQLVDKIIKGGSGVWGDIPMTPHPGVKTEDVEAMVRYILSVN